MDNLYETLIGYKFKLISLIFKRRKNKTECINIKKYLIIVSELLEKYNYEKIDSSYEELEEVKKYIISKNNDFTVNL